MLWHWASMTTVTSLAFNRDHRRTSRNIIRETTSMDRNALKLHQTLSNLGVGTRVDLTALRITEEIIQSLESTLSVVIRSMLTKITSMGNRIVDRTVRRWLLRGIVAVVSVVVGSAILGSRTRVHLRRMIVVAIGGSCKILQVSNHCNPWSDVGMCREQLVLLLYVPFLPWPP